MRYFLFLATLLMVLNQGCSSFESEDKKNKGSGDAQNGNRVDPLNTGVKGDQVVDTDDEQNDDKDIVITANDQSDILTIDGQTAVKVAWTATGFDSCVLKGSDKTGLTGSLDVGVIAVDTTYTLECKKGEVTSSKSVQVKVEPAFSGPAVEVQVKRRSEPVSAFVSGEITVSYGTDIDLRVRSTKNGSTAIYSCFLQPLAAPIQPETQVVIPVNNATQTTIYSFQCEDVKSVINTATIKVIVEAAPAISGWVKVNGVADKTYVNLNSKVSITWQAANATECKLTKRDTNPLEVISRGNGLAVTTVSTYSISGFTILDLGCTGQGGQAFETSIAIHINGQVEGQADLVARKKGVGAFTNGPLVINYGDDVEVKWSSCAGAADECNANTDVTCKLVTPFHGEFPPAGTEDSSQGLITLKEVSISQSLLLICLLPSGVAHDFLTVQIGSVPTTKAKIVANGKPHPIDPKEIYAVNVNYGDDVAITWSSENATSCSLIPFGFSALNGHFVSKNFTLTTVVTVVCNGPNGIASDSVVIRVPAGPGDDGVCKTESCWNMKVTQACSGPAKASMSIAVAMPRVGSCQYDANGNLGPFIGSAYLRLRAAEQNTVALSNIPAGSALCSANIQLANKPGTTTRSRLFYNDQFFQTISGALISTSVEDFTQNLTRSAGFFVFNKAAIIGDQGYNVNGIGSYPHYCAAADGLIVPGATSAHKSACVAPGFNINQAANLGTFSQQINSAMAIKLSTYKIVKDGKDAPFTYSLGAFGDQNTFDCSVGSDYDASKGIRLDFTVEYAPLGP